MNLSQNPCAVRVRHAHDDDTIEKQTDGNIPSSCTTHAATLRRALAAKRREVKVVAPKDVEAQKLSALKGGST